MAKGSIRPRGERSWQVRLYVGRDPATGKRHYLERTVRGDRADADEVLAELQLEARRGQKAHTGTAPRPLFFGPTGPPGPSGPVAGGGPTGG